MLSILYSLVIFVSVFAIHARSPVITSFDSVWSVYVAHSLIHEGNINLDEFRSQVKARDRFGVRKKNGHLYNYFPPGTAFAAVPFVAAYEAAPLFWIRVLPGFENARKIVASNPGTIPTALDLHFELEKIIASVFVALTAVLIFLICSMAGAARYGLIATIIFSFASPAWSTASRGLWQHGPSMLLLTTAVYLLFRGRTQPSALVVAAVPLALSFIVRPTNSVSIAVFAGYIALQHRQHFFRFTLMGLLTAAPFALGSYEVYGKIMPSYFQAGRLGLSHDVISAYLANLFSPNRGLFFFSPVFLLAPFALLQQWRSRAVDAITIAFVAVFLLHTLAVSAFPSWWGGHCYGPRYMSELAPYLSIIVGLELQRLRHSPRMARMVFTVICACLTSVSIYLHYLGAWRASVYSWNASPVNIDYQPARVWDWKDLQIAR